MLQLFFILLVLFGRSSVLYCCCGFHVTVLAMCALLLALMVEMPVRGNITSVVRRSKPFAAGSLGDNYSLLYCNDLCYDGAKPVSACALGRYEFQSSYVSFRDSGSKLFLFLSPAEYETKFCCGSIRVSGWKLYSAGSPGKNRWTCFCTGAAYSLRIQFHTLIGVSFTNGRTFSFLWCFAACIRVRFLYCWSCFYEIVFSFSAVVFVFVSYSFSDGGLCALVTCLPPRPFFGCPRRDCRVTMDIYI